MAVLVGLLLALVPAPAAGQATEAWTVSPEPLLELGAVEGDPDHVFGSVRSARLLPDGRVVVADRDGRSIRVFGRDGDLAAAMGDEGDGPGEFRALAAMWVVPPDTIQALDPARPGVTTFLADGTLVGTTRLEATPPGDARGFPDVAAGRFSGGDLALGWTVGRVSSEPRRTTDRIVLGRFGPDGAFEGLLGEGTGLERYRGSPVVFSPYPHAAVLRDSVYFTDGDAAEVDVLGPRGGGVVRTLELPLAPGDAARGWSRLAEALRAGGEADRLGRLRPRRRRERTPAIAGLLADDRGLLWVKAYDPAADGVYVEGPPPGPGGVWRVVTPRGETVAEVSVPDGVVPLDFRGDRLLGLTRDRLDVERLVVHAIDR